MKYFLWTSKFDFVCFKCCQDSVYELFASISNYLSIDKSFTYGCWGEQKIDKKEVFQFGASSLQKNV